MTAKRNIKSAESHIEERRKKHLKNPKDVDLDKAFKAMEKELIFLRKISRINLKKLSIPFTI